MGVAVGDGVGSLTSIEPVMPKEQCGPHLKKYSPGERKVWVVYCPRISEPRIGCSASTQLPLATVCTTLCWLPGAKHTVSPVVIRMTLGEKNKPGVVIVTAHVAVGAAVGEILGTLVGASVSIRATTDASRARRLANWGVAVKAE